MNRYLDEKIKNRFVSLFICLVYSSFAFLVVCSFADIKRNDSELLLISLPVMLIIFALLSFKPTRLVTVLLPPVSVIVFFGVRFAINGFSYATEPFIQFYKNFYSIFINYSEIARASEFTVLFVIALLIAFFSYYFSEASLNPMTLFLFAVIILVFQLIMGGVKNNIYFLFLISICFFSVFVYVYRYMAEKSSCKQPGMSRIIIPSAVIILTAFTLASVIPRFEAPALSERFEKMTTGNFSYYSFADSDGYSRESKLGGPIELEDTHVFNVVSQKRIKLIGSIKTEYTGNSWKFSKRNSVRYNGQSSSDAIELIYNLNYAKTVLKIPLSEGIIDTEINKISLKSQTVFVPPLLTSFNGDFSSLVYLCTDGSMMSDGSSKSLSYSVQSMSPDLKNKAVQNWLNKSYDGFYDDAKEIKSDSNISLQTLKNKKNDVTSSCLALPKNLPDRVVALANEITKGKKTDFEKATAIENYLSAYTYSLTPSELPKGSDFADFFLFDEKKGYCTSYATAMAVLCRCVGIPSRYVEGYALPADFIKNEDGIYTYKVTEKEAHTWPQVYFEGVGWIDFEPTAPYNSLENGKDIPANMFESEEDYSDFNNKEEPSTQPAQQETTQDTTEYSEPDSPTESPENQQKENPANQKKENPFLKILFAVLSVIVLLALILYSIFALSDFAQKRKWNRIRNTKNLRRAVLLGYGEILSACKYANIRKRRDETTIEFFKRLNEKTGLDFSPEKSIDLAFYGNGGLCEKDRTAVIDYYTSLKIEITESMSKSKRLIVSRFLHRI